MNKNIKFVLYLCIVAIGLIVPCFVQARELQHNTLLYKIDANAGPDTPMIINEAEVEEIEPSAFYVDDEYLFIDDKANNRILIYKQNELVNEIYLHAEMDVRMLHYNNEKLNIIYIDRFEDSASIYYYTWVDPFCDSEIVNIERINSKEEVLVDCYFDLKGNLVTEYKEELDNCTYDDLRNEHKMCQAIFFSQDVKLVSEYSIIDNKGIVKECIYYRDMIYVPEKHEGALRRGQLCIDHSGNVYQMVVSENCIDVYQLRGYQINLADKDDNQFCEGLYLERVAANFFLGERHEDESSVRTDYPQMSDYAIRSRMDTYKNLTWTYNSNRNADISVTSEPNYVTQPAWLVAYNDGQNHSVTNVPYCWGGWNAETFVSKINQGKYAGNVCTDSTHVINGTVGMDCSGYVSVAYNLPYKHSTTNMTNCFTANSTVQNVEPYDILCKSGSHVMIVVWTYFTNGIRYVDTYEESCSSGKIIYRTGRRYQDLLNDGYIPMKYNYFVKTIN